MHTRTIATAFSTAVLSVIMLRKHEHTHTHTRTIATAFSTAVLSVILLRKDSPCFK
jgi:hypothetical protein